MCYVIYDTFCVMYIIYDTFCVMYIIYDTKRITLWILYQEMFPQHLI